MPATIVVVQDDPESLGEISAALRTAGYDVAEFRDPLAAIVALERARVLITRAQFGRGRLHGIALAQMAQVRRPGIKIVFTALPEYKSEVKALGELLPLPLSVPELLETVERFGPTWRRHSHPQGSSRQIGIYRLILRRHVVLSRAYTNRITFAFYATWRLQSRDSSLAK